VNSTPPPSGPTTGDRCAVTVGVAPPAAPDSLFEPRTESAAPPAIASAPPMNVATAIVPAVWYCESLPGSYFVSLSV
jgi:hypothetical protein